MFRNGESLTSSQMTQTIMNAHRRRIRLPRRRVAFADRKRTRASREGDAAAEPSSGTTGDETGTDARAEAPPLTPLARHAKRRRRAEARSAAGERRADDASSAPARYVPIHISRERRNPTDLNGGGLGSN